MLAFARVLLLLAGSLLATGAARAVDAARVGGYDFGYVLGGDAPARPVQVFDDGRDTFVQLRSGAGVPAIFALRAGVPQLLVPLQEGPYLRVPQLHGRLLLQLGAAQATAIHARGERADAPPLTMRGASGARQPFTATPAAIPTDLQVALPSPVTQASEAVEHERSYATPLAGDRVAWSEPRETVEHAIAFARASQALSREGQQTVSRIVQRAAPDARFVVIGRDDDSDKERLEQARAEALRDALRRAGVAPERIALRTGAMRAGARAGTWESTLRVEQDAPPPAPTARTAATSPRSPTSPTSPPRAPEATADASTGGFTLAMADRTVSGAVRRWAQAFGYRLVWDAPEELDAAITGEAMLPGDSLTSALEHLLRGLQEQGYRLEVVLHANRVIRFTAAPAQPQPAARQRAPAPARDASPPLLRAGATSTS